MFTIEEREKTLKALIKYLKTLDVEMIALVGSNGNKSADQYSDIDISIVVNKKKLQKVFDECVRYVQTLDIFKYFKTYYNENSWLIGAFLNNGLELDIGFNTYEEFEKGRLKRPNYKIKIVYGDKSLEKVKAKTETNLTEEIDYLVNEAWYNIKNAMFALKRQKLFRAIKEIDDFRLDIVSAYGRTNGFDTKHFKNVDILDEEFKNKLVNTYFTQLSYNGIKKSLFNSLDLMYWVLIKSKRENEAKNYNQMFNKLAQDIKL